MDRCKGSHVLLEAARLGDDPGRFEIHLFGEFVTDEYEATLRSLARDLPVTFHGKFGPSDLIRAGLDLAVIPSVTAESFSYVVDEAMQLRTPALVSDLGALPERIGGAGAAFPVGDPERLAERIRSVLDDPGTLEAWRARIPESRGTMADHAGRVAAVYAGALEAAETTTPSTESDRDRDLVRLRTDQVDDREVRLLELEARAGYLQASGWRGQSDLALARRDREEVAAKLGSVEAELDFERSRTEELESRLAAWDRLEKGFFTGPVLRLVRALGRRGGDSKR
jgi:hypothetical protein